jgi:hypothetical protein
MRKVFGVKVDEFAEAAIFSLAWTAGLTSAYVAYYGKQQMFLATAIFLFISSVGMYYFLKLEAHQKAKREQKGLNEAGSSAAEGGAEENNENIGNASEKDDSLNHPINN